jgi:hypothetical protein
MLPTRTPVRLAYLAVVVAATIGSNAAFARVGLA